MRYKRNIGIYGENFAERILIERGYDVLERNFRGRHGEIDIIARKGSCLHFIEVKTRYGDECGYPAESVDDVKIDRIKAVAEEFIRIRRPGWRDISFDVFEIQANILEDVI